METTIAEENIFKIDYKPTEWFSSFHGYAHGLADAFDVPINVVAGVFAYLSPQKTFRMNMQQLMEVLRYGEVKNGMISNYQREKVRRLYHEREDLLDITNRTSLKIRNFYMGILEPDSQEHCVVDTHIFRVYMKANPNCPVLKGKPPTSIFGSNKKYNIIANWLKRQAKKRGLNALQMQSLLWSEERGSRY